MEDKRDIKEFIAQLKKSGVDVGSIKDKHQLEWLVNNPSFERYPVCIETFIRSKEYLFSKKCRRSVLRKMIKIFGDQEYVDKNPKKIMAFEEVADVEGIGSGKTFSASIFILYGVYRLLCLKSPQEFYNKASMSGMYFMLMSTSQKNARDVIFGEIKARILENKEGFFYKNYQPDPLITTQLNFAKNIFVIPGNSSETFFVGYNIFMAVIDECDDHKKTTEKDYVLEGYLAIRRRITSRFPGYGGLMMIGSPKTVDGFMMKMYKQSQSDKTMIGFKFATWEALDEEEFSGEKFEIKDPEGNIRSIPVEYQKDFEKNPERAWRDLGAIPSFSIEPFITLTNRIYECINPDLFVWDGRGSLPLVRGSGKKEYIAHVDLGINSDGSDHCGFAIGHIAGSKEVFEFSGSKVERPSIIIDFLARLSATPGSEIQIADIRRLILYLRDQGFSFYRVQFDGWQSKDSQQILEKAGIMVKQVSVDKDLFAYEAVKDAMYDSRLEFGNLEVTSDVAGDTEKINIVVREFRQLRRIKGNKVDHPKGGSKDVTDAIAGVVIGLTETKLLHKIGIRYSPQFVRDEINFENFDSKKYERNKKTTANSYRTNRVAIPRIISADGVW